MTPVTASVATQRAITDLVSIRRIVSGRNSLVNCLRCGIEQEDRLLLRCRPPPLALDALPMHVEVRVEQDYRLAAFTSRAANLMLIEYLTESSAASHGRRFGRGRYGR
jgi:hypothetical protein